MFVQPGKEERERIPALKNERDIRFFDVKLQNKSSGQEAEVGVQLEERLEEAEEEAMDEKAKEVADQAASAYAEVVDDE